MRSIESIERIIEYIDEHISEDITAVELANTAGYSFYHFCHLFKSCTGIPPGLYLRKRRLESAASHLSDGGSVTEAAFKYGFETHAGFTKAFRKHYGIPPVEYKTKKGGLFQMNPEIKKMASFTAIGYSLAPPDGDFDILDSSAYWIGKDFSLVSKEDYARLNSIDHGEVGAWMHPDEVSGAFYYFFGPIVKDTDFIPDGMVVLDVPEAEYAVFTVPEAGSPEELNANIRKTTKSIFTEWLDSSGYALTLDKILFEYYMGKDTFIYVPVNADKPQN